MTLFYLYICPRPFWTIVEIWRNPLEFGAKYSAKYSDQYAPAGSSILDILDKSICFNSIQYYLYNAISSTAWLRKTISQHLNNHKEVGITKSTITGSFHYCKYRGFT